ncbi:hypothetical protein AWB77_06024 [Caballeronia fortuita]|uniref:DegT/DnrJ/EryC1/StrS aminotransferase n=1 Tax=Caballeronia fortuita TaxID=1777138 RepID=A0A158E026_9BURK|nr:hypothetical protein [Caballeronia fortuita]SAK99816.1 hypothetical protein AWB77_06024 [Caballeronia fortuita]
MTTQVPQAPIGGYFELELAPPHDPVGPHLLAFQSARAAFRALLAAGAPRRVWMPRYICDSMLAPLTALGIEIAFYALDDTLAVASDVTLAPHDWLLYVNYFGVCDAQETALLARFDPSRVVLDRSQAFFASSKACLAELQSPRKFFGMPDGGLLRTSVPVDQPGAIDAHSLARMPHLLKRLYSAQEGYDDFRQAEQTLIDTTPEGMSQLSRHLYASVDKTRARVRRNANFATLHERVGHLNALALDADAIDGPLCYPLLTPCDGLRDALLRERIFTPTYWPDVKARSAPGAFERHLVDHCIALPCDQRYGADDMERIARVVLAHAYS